MQAKCFLIIIILMLCTRTLYAGEDKNNEDSIVIKALAEEKIEKKNNKAPSMELLEFLGKWKTKDGSWVDPTDLDRFIKPDMESKNDNIKKP